jgi:hypothetical protein
MLLLVVVVAVLEAFLLILIMVLVGVKRSLVVTAERVGIKTLTLKHFLALTVLQSVVAVQVLLKDQPHLAELQQLVLV